MTFYIKEWADKSATLVTAAGHHLFSFKDVASALAVCGQWYGVTADHVISPSPAAGYTLQPQFRPDQTLKPQGDVSP